MLKELLNYYNSNLLVINILLLILIIVMLTVLYMFRIQIKKLYSVHKQIINYIIVGGLTTLVSIGSYWLFRFVIKNYVILSIISWILAVLFAYTANRIFVFESKKKEIIIELEKFVSCRLITLIMEVLLMILFVRILNINDMISKIILQVVVLLLNYLFSKLFVFKGGK